MRTTILRISAVLFVAFALFGLLCILPTTGYAQGEEADLVSSESSEIGDTVSAASSGNTYRDWTELNLYNKQEARAYYNVTESIPLTVNWQLEDQNGTKYGPYLTSINGAGRHELTDHRLKFLQLQAGQLVTLTTSVNNGLPFTVVSEYREGGPQWVTVIPLKDNQNRECSAYRLWHTDIHLEQKAIWDGGQQDYPQYTDNTGAKDGQTPAFDYPQTTKPFWLENTSWNDRSQKKHHSIRGPYVNQCYENPVAYVGVVKTAGADKVQAGQHISFTLVVTTSGTTTATNVQLTDNLPSFPGANWAIRQGSANGCNIQNNVLRCVFGDLAPGTTLAVYVVSPTTAETAPQCNAIVMIDNTGTVTSDNGGSDNDDAQTGVECKPNPLWEAYRVLAVAYKNSGNVDLVAGQISVPGCTATFAVLHPGEVGYFVCEQTPLEGTASYNGQPVQPTIGILKYQWIRDPDGNWLFLPVVTR